MEQRLFLVMCTYATTVSSTFDPKLMVQSCTMGKLLVEVSGASDSGIIYIQGQGENCRLMTSAELQLYEFDFKECGIQWEMIMRVIIQQKSGYQTGNDKRIPILCVADTSDLVASNLLAAQKEDNFGMNLTTRPGVVMRFFKALSDEEVIGSEIKLSDKLIMSLQLDSEYTDDFDIKAKYCSASGIPLISNYCTLDEELFPNFWKLRQGHLLSEFGAFRPTSLEGGAVLINFTCIVKLCQGYCSPSLCNDVYNGQGRRKRSLENGVSKSERVSSKESKARFKRQSEVEDLLDIGRTIKVVEKYSDIRILDESEICWDKFLLIMIIMMLGGGCISAVVCSLHLLMKLQRSKDIIRILKHLPDEDKLGNRKLTAMQCLDLGRGGSLRGKHC